MKIIKTFDRFGIEVSYLKEYCKQSTKSIVNSRHELVIILCSYYFTTVIFIINFSFLISMFTGLALPFI